MSTQALAGVPAGELALAQRVQQLQALIESAQQVAGGGSVAGDPTATTTAGSSPESDFASALQAATAADADSAAGTSAPAGLSYGGYQPTGYQPLSYAASAYATSGVAGQALAGAPAGGEAGEGGQYEALIEQAATRNGIEPALLHGLIEQESGFDAGAVSSAGASGLTQLMPSTASSLGVAEPLDPVESIEGGARLLGELMRQFAGNAGDALAAYNAGPGAVQEYGGVPPYSETQSYVSKVLGYAESYRHTHPDTTGALT
ncbi:MAG TPA: lytic transglycosylase domain-containing protein [Solirubrobacteraceae bacterium]|nr:lytic transglycosylase domain-containing protein [Solirubrobacteraceae bacterium]